MSDNLERFIRQNRRDFDEAQPSAELWSKIQATVPVRKNAKRFTLRDIYKWSAVAAMIVIILCSVYFLVTRKNSHEIVKTDNPAEQVNPNESGIITPEYAAEFTTVYRSIGEKQKELQTLTAEQPGLYQQFQQDLLALDSSYQLLMTQAAHSPNRDVLLRAMIQNLRLQAELLSRQLNITNQLNNSKNSSHETSI
ncbi:MAG TPA: hypothetical protein VMZ03_05110 [Chitinophagaceae bacterium]|nr:hypothetical protein [Chitinophagaceae bacterium]